MGCGQDRQIFIIILNIFIIYFLFKFLIKNYKIITNIIKICIIIIISGGVSNIIDRLTRGYVVDYIDVNKLVTFPVFNIADISIVIGIAVLIGYIIIKTIKKQENA